MALLEKAVKLDEFLEYFLEQDLVVVGYQWWVDDVREYGPPSHIEPWFLWFDHRYGKAKALHPRLILMVSTEEVRWKLAQEATNGH